MKEQINLKILKESKSFKTISPVGNVVKHRVFLLEDNGIKIVHHVKRILVDIDVLPELRTMKVFKNKKLVQDSHSTKLDTFAAICNFIFKG